jgi:hypothetical protein
VVGAAEADIRYSECSGIEYREQEPAGGKRCAMRARHVVEELTLRSHQVDGIVAANHDLIPPEAYSTARPWLEATAVIEAGRQSPCLVANSVAALASSGIAASGICPLRSAPDGMFRLGLSCDREPSPGLAFVLDVVRQLLAEYRDDRPRDAGHLAAGPGLRRPEQDSAGGPLHERHLGSHGAVSRSISQRRSAVNGSDAIEMSRLPFPDPRVDQPPDLPAAAANPRPPGRVGAGLSRFGCVGAIHRG